MRTKLLFIASIFCFATAGAQDFKERSNKGRIFATYGVNRTAYDLSSLNMVGDGYNFRLTHFDANDGFESLDFSKFNAKLGFFITEKLSISIGYDNFTYSQIEENRVKIGGTIGVGDVNDNNFDDTYFESRDVIRTSEDFITYGYTSLNYINLNLEINDDFWVSKNGKFAWSYYFGLGGGIVMTESNVKLFGVDEVDNNNGLSGFGGNASFGTRFNAGPVFLEIGGKAGYMRTEEVVIPRNGVADHTFIFASGIGSLGLSFQF